MAKFFQATQEEIDAIKTRIARVAPKAAFTDVGQGQHIDHATLRARPSVHVVETKDGLSVLVDKRLMKALRDEYASKLTANEKLALASKIATAIEPVESVKSEVEDAPITLEEAK